MAPIIREAKPKDIQYIIELTKEIAAFEKNDFDPEGKTEKLNQHLFGKVPRLHCLLIEKENKIIGFATYSIEFSLFQADNYLRINSFYIKSTFRRQGLGKTLLNKVKKASKRLHCKSIQFFTPDFNIEAVNFYKRMGANSTNSVRFYLDADEA